MLVIVVVKRRTAPGVVVAALVVVLIVSWDTVTVAEHRGSVLPDPQLLPAAAELTVLARMWFPVSGLFTVTENVIVAVAPIARLPVQVRFGLVNDTVPAVAAASPL